MNNTGNWCGKCKYHECTEPRCKESVDAEWVCSNPDSDYYADITEYTDGGDCMDFEERD